MKVLLDHNIPHGLREHFPSFCTVYTASYLGWSSYSDDALLRAAVENAFAILVTLDSNLQHQQDLGRWPLGIIVLDVHPATPHHLASQMDAVNEILRDTAENNRLVVIP